MASYTADLKKILREHGCQFHRQGRGDHEIWITPSGKRFAVDNNIVSRHLANKVLKSAGIEKCF